MAEASNNQDALGLLSAALNAQDGASESRHLTQLYTLFQTQPGNLAILLPSLVSLVPRAKEALKRWIADVLDLAFCRATLSSEGRNALAIHTPDAVLAFLNDSQLIHAKKAIQVFASTYTPLFRQCCNDPSYHKTWQTIERIKERIAYLFEQGPQGVKVAAIKAFQKIIQVQTRAGADPRSRNVDVSVSMVPNHHGFLQPAALEGEANRLLTSVVTLVFTSGNCDLIMACLNTLSLLAKARPPLSKIVIEALVSWTPAALAGQPYTHIRNAEKTLRLVFAHFERHNLTGPHRPQIQEALQAQRQRMEAAARADWERKEAEAKRKRENIDQEIEQSEKRQRMAAAEPSSSDASSSLSGIEGAHAFCRAAAEDTRPNPLAVFDATTLQLPLVIDLIMANLTAVPDEELQRAIERTRSRLHGMPQAPPPSMPPGPPPLAASASQAVAGPPPTRRQIKAEESGGAEPMQPLPGAGLPENPLKQDLEDEDLRKLDQQGAANQSALTAPGQELGADEEDAEDALAGLEDFELAPPEPFSQTEAKALIKEAVGRMCDAGGQAAAGSAEFSDAVPSQTLWATLVIRLASRGFETVAESPAQEGENDGESGSSSSGKPLISLRSHANVIRQQMLDFLSADFSRRIPFAIQWLSEEWFCDVSRRKRGQETSYNVWLPKVVKSVLPHIEEKDRTLFHFLAELPSLPDEVVDLVAGLCHDKERMAVGFMGLREFAVSRPPIRERALKQLLDLSRNADNGLRQTAIKTVRGWVGGGGPFEAAVLESARESIKRLTVKGENGKAPDTDTTQKSSAVADTNKVNGAANVADGDKGIQEGEGEGEGEGEEGERPQRDPTKDWSFALENASQVLQFVEMPFVLSVKIPSMLDEVFAAYPAMSTVVQKGVEQHIAALVRSLGPSNPKLLDLLKTFPRGADGLALSVFTVMAEKGRTQALLTTVKNLVSDRDDVDAHFLIPILPHCTKPEILKLLPKAVTILNSKLPEDRTTIKNLFASVVSRPEQGFGSVSTNQPRVRDSQLLQPHELLGLLHSNEEVIGLKTTAEAIRICFSMTDLFTSSVLAAALNQLVEEPHLATLFMRTAIMAVTTYKSLSGFISSNILSRLIVKKIWQNELPWKGFVICAEQTAPGSFAALFQLPSEQLVDVVRRAPGLKEGLKGHLEKKGANNKARTSAYLELIEGAGAASPTASGAGRGGTPGGAAGPGGGSTPLSGSTPLHTGGEGQ
ncbi:hypothetical protein BDZ90DRAFT_238127 [Jaminaea rosea]|uniref:Symplekin n=1 Tax=Jaminaea rosea TaxID=1569628 RepID=A0A316UWA2_9BASI|nr:hypothetical protein BDZ90DRAFT_238127 [Jaminaea rosea]PWN29078.1 hypothetical protein BDZ90DRAFT_238127 [Jaminaea rosea]